jgi:hypothetical protein
MTRSIVLLALLAACHERVSPRTDVPAEDLAPLSSRYDADAIRTQVAELSSKLAIDGPARVELREKLDALLANPSFLAEMSGRGVQAVGIYRWGEGGLVVKIARGDGTVRFAGQARDRHFDLEYASVGAQVGGSASWGVVLGLGLPSVEGIEGSFTGDVASATAIDENAGTFTLSHGDRQLWFVGVAEGLSANAGEGKLKLALRD